MNKTFIFILKTKLSERGYLLPYMLFIMLTISSFIVATYDKVIFHEEQEQLLQEQHIIQNIIELSIYDFLRLYDDLDATSTLNHMTLKYKHGIAHIEYFYTESLQVQLNIRVETNSGTTYNDRIVIDV